MILFRVEHQTRYDHFFKGNTSVLVGVPVIADVVVEVVDVRQEVVVFRKDIRTAHVDGRQSDAFRVFHRIYVAFFIRQAAPGFVAQVEAGVLVADDLRRILHVDGAVVGGQYQAEAKFLRLLDDFEQGRIAEPTQRK